MSRDNRREAAGDSAEGNSSSNGRPHESFNKSRIALEPVQRDKRPFLLRVDRRHAVIRDSQNYDEAINALFPKEDSFPLRSELINLKA